MNGLSVLWVICLAAALIWWKVAAKPSPTVIDLDGRWATERLSFWVKWNERERCGAVVRHAARTASERVRERLANESAQPEPERPAHVAQFIRRRQ